MSDEQPKPHAGLYNTRGVPGPTEEADTASGGAPEPRGGTGDPMSGAALHNDTDPDLGPAEG